MDAQDKVWRGHLPEIQGAKLIHINPDGESPVNSRHQNAGALARRGQIVNRLGQIGRIAGPYRYSNERMIRHGKPPWTIRQFGRARIGMAADRSISCACCRMNGLAVWPTPVADRGPDAVLRHDAAKDRSMGDGRQRHRFGS